MAKHRIDEYNPLAEETKQKADLHKAPPARDTIELREKALHLSIGFYAGSGVDTDHIIKGAEAFLQFMLGAKT